MRVRQLMKYMLLLAGLALARAGPSPNYCLTDYTDGDCGPPSGFGVDLLFDQCYQNSPHNDVKVSVVEGNLKALYYTAGTNCADPPTFVVGLDACSAGSISCPGPAGQTIERSFNIVQGQCSQTCEECPEECGCGYTQGYWRNHCDQSSLFGGLCNAKNVPWPSVGTLANPPPTENRDSCEIIGEFTAVACGCGGNVLDDLWNGYNTPGGNPARNLHRQFVAAVLNTEKDVDPACTEPIDLAAAAAILASACDGLDAGEETTAGELTELLDDYNNGRLADTCGPEHCDGTFPPEECPEPPCELCSDEGAIVPHGGQLFDHRDGSLKPPVYCLRLDEGTAKITYSCVREGSEAYWQIYEDGSLRVWGSVYGGQDIGETWDNPKHCSINAEYRGFECCASPEGSNNGENDLCASGEGSGELTITCEGEDPVVWYSKPRYNGGENTVIGDFHRGAGETFSLFGWLQRTGISGTHDWLAELSCQRQECPPGPVTPPEDDCGCGYTIGYWGSPRFVAEDEECMPWQGRIPSGGSNHDTCRWPALGGEDSREKQICTIPCEQHPDFDGFDDCTSPNVPVTWWDILQNNYNRFGAGRGRNRVTPFSQDWYNAARQAIAFELNRGIGFCGNPRNTPSNPDTEEECDALNGLSSIPEVAALLSSCPSEGEFLCPEGNVHCDYLCGLVQFEETLGEEGDGCKLSEIFDLANNGELGPDHCEDDDTNANLRGCCAGRGGFESCTPDSLFHFNEESPVTECCDEECEICKDDCALAYGGCIAGCANQPCIDACNVELAVCTTNCENPGLAAAFARPANGPPSPPMMQNGCDGLEEALENKEALEIATLIFVILAFLAVLILMIYLCVRARGGDSPLINIPFMSGGRATLADHVGGKVQ